MTRLISNSTRSSWAASTDGGTGEPGLPGELSIGVLAALLTWLPGHAGPRFRGGVRRQGGRPTPQSSVLHVRGLTLVRRAVLCASSAGPKRASTPPARRTGRLLA